MKYLVTIQTEYGSLTVDDIEATSYRDAEETALVKIQLALECSKIAETYEYPNNTPNL